MQVYNPSSFRVKVYKLNGDGNWDDKGTGLVSAETMEHSNAMGLVVLSEDDEQRTLLIHRILKDDIYNRQEDTIITWSDPDLNTEIALSFQESAGCHHIWQQIQTVQKDAQARQEMQSRRRLVDEFEQASAGDYQESEPQGQVEVPAPEMSNLEELAKLLSQVPPHQRERLGQQLAQGSWLPKLLDIFKQCEDLEDLPSLHHLHTIMKSIIMLNETSLLEELLREEYVMDCVGTLEYDPDCGDQPQKHREFLRDHVVFKEVVPIKDAAVLAKVHQTYRIQYLKDVVLPRVLDDGTYATLSSMALFNSVEVIVALASDPTFLPQLFIKLKKHSPSDPEWHDLVAFLQELCNLAKHLQPQGRQQLFHKLVQLGMFEVVTKIMAHSADEVKLKATDILVSVVSHDAAPLRLFLLGQKGDSTLFGRLMGEFVGPSDNGLPEQIAELLKLLLDPETMEGNAEKSDFLELFYDKHMGKLLAPLSAPGGDGCAVPVSTLGLIVDLLCFCAQHHQFRIKYYSLRNNVGEKVLRLVRRRERWLVCAAIRFVRTCIGMKDDFFNRYLTRNNLFEPVLTVFFENGERYNLLNSAVLEMVDFIRRENIKPLVEHLVEIYGDRFEDISYVSTFRELSLKYQQNKEGAAAAAADTGGDPSSSGLRGRMLQIPSDGPAALAANGSSSSSVRRKREARELDRDEESYFESGEDEEEASGPASSGPSERRSSGGAAAAAAAAGGGGSPERPGSSGRGSADVQQQQVGTSPAANGPRQQSPQQQQQQQQQQQRREQQSPGDGGGTGDAVRWPWLANLLGYGDEEEEEQQQKQQTAPQAKQQQKQQQSPGVVRSTPVADASPQQRAEQQRQQQAEPGGSNQAQQQQQQPAQDGSSQAAHRATANGGPVKRSSESPTDVDARKRAKLVELATAGNSSHHTPDSSPVAAAAAAAPAAT